MLNTDGRHPMRNVAWLAMATMAASCRFDLPDAPVDVPADVPTSLSSCVDFAQTCGPGANENCCQAKEVPGTDPGSMFYRSYDVASDMNFPNTSAPATVSTFVLDRYEVTVGRFRAFVNAGMGTQASPPAAGSGAHPKLAGSGWDSNWNANLVTNTAALTSAVKCVPEHRTWTDTPGANENKPMNCVTWYEAMAFCIWDGGRLPSELEWNYAASGGSEQRVYPWSNPANLTTVDCTYANYKPGMYCVNDPTGATNRVGSESPKGDSRWGHSDLAGNVYEWTLDWHVSAYPLPCSDCANLIPSSLRVIRGGGLFTDETNLRAAFRYYFTPTDRGAALGLRCARTP